MADLSKVKFIDRVRFLYMYNALMFVCYIGCRAKVG